MENKNFKFSGADTVALAEKYGTPLYVMSEDIILEKLRHIKEHFLDKYPNTRALYASKVFLSLHMCQIVKSQGFGFDTVSEGEIYTALKAGVDPKDMVFHGNNKTPREIAYAVGQNVGKLVVDSFSEIALLDTIANDLDRDVEVLVRINPSTEPETHKYMSTGQKDSKFGVPLVQVAEAVKQISQSKHMKYKGMHFHIGSMVFKSEFHITAARKAIDLIADVRKTLGIDTDVLNLGGGYGVDYLDSRKTISFESFMDEIMGAIEQECRAAAIKRPEICIEPGRWIVAEAGITLYTVGVVKEIPGVRTYVSVDGGMPDNPRPSLYGAKYNAVVANKWGQAPDAAVAIAGKCCESGDILIQDIKLPKMERGDYLAVFDTGAYNYSMSSNYNRLCRPPVVFIKDGVDTLSIKRETYEDLLKLDLGK